jgi:hypoxanthine-guanine phosphoribosyltransferase
MKELLTAEDIQFKTKIIGKQIADKHRGDKTPVVMVGLLKWVFCVLQRFSSCYTY